jgi:NAD-dependent dihydropyrimidine dehydrogenase PreA subunit
MKILFCNCSHYDVVPDTTREPVLRGLREAGVAFTAVGDLCGLVARRDPVLQEIAGGEPIRIAACYPRSVRALFHAAGADLPAEGVAIANMRLEDAAAVLARLLADAPKGEAKELEPLEPEPGTWVPWFPVIDYERCVNCKQCANFCLFGVYTLTEDGGVQVHNPDHCKTNCPACARMCPRGAIIFPKYGMRPINGDEVTPEDLKRDDMAVDPAELRGNVYEKLRARGAGADAKPGLAALKDSLDIPQEAIDAAAGKPSSNRPCSCRNKECEGK